ncbi:uncharacterized protein LOC119595167 [Penaeus monodon]|uniref:uncharacterized protein LOC119595167 n=1 Tax=Penaeus monodon TaxID=6687 RepID=UPI0018A7C12D|nr:uncharacterized protein LOC119595167 [Penaeus monodon]
MIKRADINNSNFDWSEKMFLQVSQRYSSRFGTRKELVSESPAAKGEPPRDDHTLDEGTNDLPGSSRDQLIPGTPASGLWWWDSSLPINLAEIEECNELHRRDLVDDLAYTGPPLQCRPAPHGQRHEQ